MEVKKQLRRAQGTPDISGGTPDMTCRETKFGLQDTLAPNVSSGTPNDPSDATC
jgi:hypothetical protein